MKLRVVKEVDSKKWSRLLQSVRQASIFHTQEWSMVITNTYPRRMSKYIIVENSFGDIVAGMPFVDRSEMGVHILSSMPLGTYGGPLLKSDIDRDIETKILNEFCTLEHFPMTILRRVVSFGRRLDFLLTQNFKETIDYTNILSLDSSLDVIWTNKLHHKIRNQIRQAQQRGVSTEIYDNPPDLKEFYKMVLETSKRHGNKPLPFNLYQNIFEIMGTCGFAKLCLARHSQSYVAASICFTFKDTIFYWMNASHKEFWNLRPNNLIIWTMIEWAHRNGFKYFNFGATPHEAQGLKRFKLRWGTEEVPCYEYEKKAFIFNLLK